MTNAKIRKVEFLYVNQPSRRKIKVTLTNSTKIYIESCYESYQQYGGTTDELWLTISIAEKYNDWLHVCHRNTIRTTWMMIMTIR